MSVERADVLEWAASYTGPPFHALLCDPPYHLTSQRVYSEKRDVDEIRGSGVLRENIEKNTAYGSLTRGFMGMKWDGSGIAFKAETWAALARHLHPGAFLMAFASSRGWHRQAVAMEDAGLVIHPSLFGWAFGSGFPKATRIDKPTIGGTEDRDEHAAGDFGMKNRCSKCGKPFFSGNPCQCPRPKSDSPWAGHRYGLQALKPALEPVIVAQKPYEEKPVESITRTGAGALWIDGGRVFVGQRPNSSRRPWEPENILCASCASRVGNETKREAQARKATSAIRNAALISTEKGNRPPADISKADIGCSVGLSPAGQNGDQRESTSLNTVMSGKSTEGRFQAVICGPSTTSTETGLITGLRICNLCGAGVTSDFTGLKILGRWPSNFYLADPEAAARLDERSGDLKSGFMRADTTRTTDGGFHGGFPKDRVGEVDTYGDSGGASRFFFTVAGAICEADPVYYTPKAGRWERDVGLYNREIVYIEPLDKSDERWGSEVPRVRLRVDTAQSPPKVIGVSGIPKKNALEWNTFLFGNAKKAPSLLDSGSITVTATNSTTESKTLNWLIRLLTSESIPVVDLKTENGGSHAENAEDSGPFLTITSDAMGFILGVAPVLSRTPWKIKGNAGPVCDHPTVKPLDLTRYLARLLLPPAAYAPRRLLVPFAGVGSEVIGGLLAGWEDVVGIEREADYCAMAEARITYWREAGNKVLDDAVVAARHEEIRAMKCEGQKELTEFL